jgi:hypothetical protein
MGRLALVLPATAIGLHPSLGWAWRFSSAYWPQCALTIGVLPLILKLLVDSGLALLPIGAAAVIGVAAAVYLGIVGIALLAFSFGFLRDAQPELLPPAAEDEDEDGDD